MKYTSAKQMRVLFFIRQFVDENGYPPTAAEIAQAFEYKSPNAATCHLKQLAKRGHISITPHVSRGIKLLDRVAA